MTRYVSIFVWTAIGICAVAVLIIMLMFLYNASKVISIKRLEYKRYFSEDGIYEGEQLYLVEELSNHSFVPMFHVDVQSHVTSKIKLEGCSQEDEMNQHFISRFTIMPFTTVKRSHKAIGKKRGFYQLETAKVVFAGMDLYLESKASLHVFPQELAIKEKQHMNRYLQYDTPTKLPVIEDPFSFTGIREYYPGAPLSAINFKASAKRGQLMVNSKEYLLGRQIQLYVNFQMPEKGVHLEMFERVMEKALQYVSYMVGEAVGKGYRIGFSTNSRMANGTRFLRYPMNTGMVHYRELLKELAMIRIVSGNSFVSVIDMDIAKNITASDIYLFTMYLDESIDSRIEILKRMGNEVTVIWLEEMV